MKKSLDMPNEKGTKKKPRKGLIRGFVVAVLMMAGLCILLGYNIAELMKDNKVLDVQAINAKSQVNSTAVENETLNKQLTASHDELSKLKERMAGIKNADDLLKRDIFHYIDKKFQIIPRSVALEIAEQILAMSKKHEVSPELVVGIMQIESAFNPMAISKANARGLMQVMPEWAPKFGLKKVSDLHDIPTGIESGIKVLKIHIEESKGNITKGLYHYVGKSDSYAGKVYQAMGKFVTFRSTIDDDDVDVSLNSLNGKEGVKKIEPVKGTEANDN